MLFVATQLKKMKESQNCRNRGHAISVNNRPNTQ